MHAPFNIFPAVVAIIGLAVCLPARAAVSVTGPTDLFDIDFTASQLPVGSSVPVGPGGTTISEIRFGRITVGTNPISGSKAAVFNTTGNSGWFYYDQAALDVAQAHPAYYFKMDFVITGLIASTNKFAISFDTPTVQTLEFGADGRIRASTGTSPPVGFSKRIVGTYLESVRIALEVAADTQANRWRVSLNGEVVDTGLFWSSGGLLNSVRLTLGNRSSVDPVDGRSSVYVDRVYLAVPEPSVLTVCGVCSLLGFRRRRAAAP